MKTRKLTITALLTALSIVIPMVMPVKIVLPPFTATLASHTPLIIAMFISPLTALITSLGSALGFWVTLGPVVAARASMHVIFTVAGAIMVRKNCDKFLIMMVTLVLHSLSDMATVWVINEVFTSASILKDQAMGAVQVLLGLGTAAHHILDYAIAIAVIMPISKAFPRMFNQNQSL
jgi:niacin transporter